jgi:hypothetical protein
MSITISGITDLSTHLSGNPIYITGTTSAIPAGATEYKILLKVESADGLITGGTWINGVFEEGVFVDGVPPDGNDAALFDISGWVDQAVAKDFTWPIPGLYDAKWHAFANQVYEVDITAGERYIDSNGALVETWGTKWGTLFIVKGKLPEHMLAEFNGSNTNWFAEYITEGRWFTLMPLSQKVAPYQPVKLWWKPPTDGLTFQYKIKAYYDDGSTAENSGDPVLYYDGMFEFEAQPTAQGLGPVVTTQGVTKRLLYYEVWIEGTPDVEKRTFVLDWSYHEEVWYLFADNQIGGIDCIYLSGAAEAGYSGERTIARKPLPKGAGSKIRSKVVTGASRTRTWKLNSGHKDRAEIEAMGFLLDSANVWLAIPPVGGSNTIADYDITPVNVVSSTLTGGKNTDDLFAFELEIEEAR